MTRWVRRRDVFWRTAPGYLVISSLSGRTMEVHGPGHDVWDLLAEASEERAIVDTLARQYGADVAVVEPDVHGLLLQLAEFGCVDSLG